MEKADQVEARAQTCPYTWVAVEIHTHHAAPAAANQLRIEHLMLLSLQQQALR